MNIMLMYARLAARLPRAILTMAAALDGIRGFVRLTR
jgi:hypothetical protein